LIFVLTTVHHDYLHHERDRQQGPRILTAYLYLNEVEEGGETNFPELNVTVAPKRGRVAIWPSVFSEFPSDKDGRTEHQALPVIKGEKYGKF
jgi:prolyl 4-hydroxylase